MVMEHVVISELKIVKYSETNSCLLMKGSFEAALQAVVFKVKTNETDAVLKAYRLHTEGSKNHTLFEFELLYDLLPANMNSLNVYAVFDGTSEELISLNSETMQQYEISSSILYQLNSADLSNQPVVSVEGWVFSFHHSKVHLKILDEKGNICPSTMHWTLQQRLFECNILSREEMLCGFRISFCVERGHQYQLQFDDESHQCKAPLDSYLQNENESGLSHIFRMLNKKNFKRAADYLRRNGLLKFIKRLKEPIEELPDYNAWMIRNRVTEEELEQQKKDVFPYAPKISILVPAFNTPKKLLREMIDSVQKQSYENWQLCIADASEDGNTASDIIDEYCADDKRIICNHLHANYGISDNTNKALELADGDYIALFDHDDLLEPDCLYEIVKALQNERYDILYTDEDKLNDDTGEFEDPNFKPDYNPDLLLSHNYITHFFVVRREIMNETGGFRKEYDGSQDYDVILRCLEKSKNIYHIPKPLYHWRMHEGSTAADPKSKMYCYVAGEKALNDHLKRAGVNAHAEMMPEPFWGLYHTVYATPGDPLVSVVIPNCDHVDILKTCVNSLFEKNEYQNIEIIIVENNSREKETYQYYEELQKEHANVRVVTWQGEEFNYSSINNFGVSKAKGEYILLLNNDTEVIEPKAIREMLGVCMRDDVGCVGAKLLYRDNTIQHAGVILGFSGYAGHVFMQDENDKEFGYVMEAVCNMDYSAVTAACMMTKKSVYEKVDGMDERFHVAGNDVDYCLKVGQAGYRVVYNAHALWHHYESKSRGYENSLEKIRRFDQEVTLFQKKWKEILIHGDPAYNPNFKIEDAPYWY